MGKIDIKKYNQKDVVYVFGFSSTDKLLSRSPFVSKLLLFLRWKKVPYQHVTLGDPRKAPRNKFPFAVLNGELIADSEEIILRVRQHFSLPPTEGEAEARKKTIGVRRVCEDHLYWVVRFTWITDEGWKKYKASLPKVPAMLAKTIYNAILNGNRDQAHAQGVWRKSGKRHTRTHAFVASLLRCCVASSVHLCSSTYQASTSQGTCSSGLQFLFFVLFYFILRYAVVLTTLLLPRNFYLPAPSLHRSYPRPSHTHTHNKLRYYATLHLPPPYTINIFCSSASYSIIVCTRLRTHAAHNINVEEEVMREGREDKEYLEAMLEAAGGEYFGGNSVGDIDCVVAGMVSVIIDSDVSSKLQDLFRESATLVKYTERVFEAVGACPPFTSSTAEIENDK
mmetsp:Transcript_17538/g.43711  ORF Transcript_17538/g.43711 Transcript_17538/m.43711 type:complete len:394 (-) Transcript_17538:346-1527(-)